MVFTQDPEHAFAVLIIAFIAEFLLEPLELYNALESRWQLRAYDGVKGTQLVSLDEALHHASQWASYGGLFL